MGDRSQSAQQGAADCGRPAFHPYGLGGRLLRADPHRHRHCLHGRADQLPADRRQDPARVRAGLYGRVVHRQGQLRFRGRVVQRLRREQAHLHRQVWLGLRNRRGRFRQSRSDLARPSLRLPIDEAALQPLHPGAGQSGLRHARGRDAENLGRDRHLLATGQNHDDSLRVGLDPALNRLADDP
ncbi:hypothetical protein D3C81_845260 [compost metagenome]